MSNRTILFVDSEPDFLAWAGKQVETVGVRVLTESSAEDGYRLFCAEQPDLVFAELGLKPYSGQELLVKIRQHSPNALVVVVGDYGTTQAVIETMKLGAFDFVRKEQLPFNLKGVVEAGLQARADLLAASAPMPQLTIEQHREEMVGRSDAMQQVFKMIGRVAASDVAVMISGESGTGKELVARALHHYSGRSHRSFLAINCAAIPDNLLESELFGHERGAFTGAHNMRTGRFEQCDGGTLFLDEIGEMPLLLQSKLLRVLQEGEFTRVGGNETLRTDVRIVAATNKNLEQEVAAKRFREDLFYRLDVVRIHLPPLRQRKEDIRLLAEYFLQRIANRKLRPLVKLSEEAIALLEQHPWPGNVRELENTIERACVLATGDLLLARDLPMGTGPAPERSATPGTPLSTAEIVSAIFERLRRDPGGSFLAALEQQLAARALEQSGGAVATAAHLLGKTPATLRKLLAAKPAAK